MEEIKNGKNMEHNKQYRLLAVKTDESINIGDYIQALADMQFLPAFNGFVERERIGSYDGSQCRIIMNGWFMHNPAQWPPSQNIDPLFVAFHINSLAKTAMLTEKGVEYLKAHEPIGCRDTYTVELLKQKGVDAYFSGCMTLTLGFKYRSTEKDGSVYFVDPYFVTKWSVANVVKNAWHLLTHWKAINTIAKKYPEQKKGLRKRMILAGFHKQYSRIFTEDTLLRATYVCQQSSAYSQFTTDAELLQEAERLVMLYAKASLVVTSRIHCALPCLGMGTPVLYTEDACQSEASRCRLGGLRNLFNILTWKDETLRPEFPLTGKISTTQNIPQNKNEWQPLAFSLMQRIQQWISE